MIHNNDNTCITFTVPELKWLVVSGLIANMAVWCLKTSEYWSSPLLKKSCTQTWPMLTSLYQPVLHLEFHWSGIGVQKSGFITIAIETLQLWYTIMIMCDTSILPELKWLVDGSSRIIREPGQFFHRQSMLNIARWLYKWFWYKTSSINTSPYFTQWIICGGNYIDESRDKAV